MKVEVNSITEEGIVQEENIRASKWDLDTPDVNFIKDIHIHCHFRKLKDEILVKTKVLSDRRMRCSRCLRLSTHQTNQEFYLSYNKKTVGQFLEVDDKIREEILLDWPLKPLCKDDCRGICPKCGKDLNLETCSCNQKKDNNFKKLTA